MIKLKSLRIGNFRKFSEEVSIEFSQGVTIFLAPNGTGKTTVFEAIELALTGKVERLISGQAAALLRDGAESSELSLDFGLWQRTIALSRFENNARVLVPGRLEDIFGGIDAEDIPYLLRLTHLLDQRERHWFVNVNETDEAGKILSKLPVSRDATAVKSKLMAAKGEFTKEIGQLTADLRQAKQRCEEWDTALAERKRSLDEAHTQLEPLSEIAGCISSEIVADEPENVTLLDVENVFAVEWNTVEARQKKLAERIKICLALSHVPESHSESQQTLNTAQLVLQERSVELNRHHQGLAQLQERLKAEQSKIASIEREILDAQQRLDKSNRIAALTSEVEALRISVDEMRASVAHAQSSLEQHELQLQEFEQSARAHEAIEIHLGEVQRKKNLLDSGHDCVVQIKEKSASILSLDDGIAKCMMEIGSLEALGKSAKERKQVLEQIAAASDEALRLLSDALGEIRGAVHVVMRHLPPDENNCPVCGVLHSPGELQQRIIESLEKGNPNLVALTVQSQSDHKSVDKAQAECVRLERELVEKKVHLQELHNRQEEMRRVIKAAFEHPLVSGVAFDQLESYLSEVAADIGRVEAEIQHEKLKLSAAVGRDVVTNARLELENKKLRIAAMISSLASMQNMHDQKSELLAVQGLAEDVSQLGVLVRRLEELRDDRTKRQAEENQVRADMKKTSSEAEAVNLRLRETNTVIAAIKERMASLEAHWRSSSMEGMPDAKLLQAVLGRLDEEKLILERKCVELEKCRAKISRWKLYMERNSIQQRIDSMRQEKSETEFNTLLLAEISKTETEIHDLCRKRDAFHKFEDFLTQEISTVQNAVKGVEPCWQALLGRIVRDSRFSVTQLEFSTRRSKSHASVRVPLSGQHIPVADVASEAQLADLQLSLLLAMAVNHKWSHWRALLLDDPTQHHDLGHASAVFDVLRDYVADHGFQVVMATHDATQARYFMRKLVNDGLPAKLMALRPSKFGVKPELLSESGF